MTEPDGIRVLVLARADVDRLLDLDHLRRAIGDALAEVSAGRVSMPNRVAASIAERDAMLAAMPAYLPSAGALTTKLVSLFPRNRDRPTHQAVLVCFDAEHGTPAAVMDATSITAARTAAASALATELLARAGARTLAVLGTGVQAKAHARAVARVRAFDRIVIAGRDIGRAAALAEAVRDGSGLPIEVATSFEEAVRLADVVCATTHAPEPVVRWRWLGPGTHVTSVGFNTAGTGEVDAETVVRAAVFVESRDAALAPPPSGAIELTGRLADGSIDASHVRAELGEVVAGTAPGRTSDEEVTLYKSVGIAAEDAAAAALILQEARRAGAGTVIEL
jgi:ornithine cyclodeaminase/alanine dehydrogenase-like protein (mu-crystallin family)